MSLKRAQICAARARASTCSRSSSSSAWALVSATSSSCSSGVFEAAPQRAPHALVEVVEQRGLPRVPELRVRAADVRDREQVQVVEVRLVADRAREFLDHLGVGDVLLLRRDREDQVVAHEPGDEPRVVARQPLLEAERLGIDGAELGVVAAAALGDVVEQRREVGDLRALERRHQPRHLGQLVLEAGQGEAAQVAQHEQDVRVHRVGVEQVVLHAADHAAERRDVTTEHAVQVHAAQLVRDAGRRAQQLEEQPVVARVLPELLVDEPEVAAQQADRRRAHAADVRACPASRGTARGSRTGCARTCRRR